MRKSAKNGKYGQNKMQYERKKRQNAIHSQNSQSQ